MSASEWKSRIPYIRSKLEIEDVLLGIAEEAGELVSASSKYLRIERGNNPTPVTKDEAWDNFKEECADVMCLMHVMFDEEQIGEIDDICNRKMERWEKRIKAANE